MGNVFARYERVSLNRLISILLIWAALLICATAARGQNVEKACPLGTQVMSSPDAQTLDTATNLYRQWLCLNLITGQVTIQPDSGAYAFASYTLSVSGGLVTATPGIQGGSAFSNADARVVWDSVVSALSSTCGTIYVKNGVYNANSFDQESTGGFSNFYAWGFPASAGTNQYCQWFVVGESNTPLVDQFSTPVQTAGVIFNITSTALGTVTATNKVMGFWARPDTAANAVGASVFLKNIDIRVPTNQRGCETASDLSQALNSDYYNVVADTAVAQNSLAFPVETACTAWGGTDPGGLIGLTTTNSSKEENQMNRSFAIGADVCLDIRSEHTVLTQSAAANCNHGIDYGVRGNTVTAGSVFIQPYCATTARCLTLGANLRAGTLVDIHNLGFEDANGGIFAPVYHALETTSGNSYGILTYENSIEGVGMGTLNNPFDGGGGVGFVTQYSSMFSFNRDAGCPVGAADVAEPCFDIYERVTGNSKISRELRFHATNSTGIDTPFRVDSAVDSTGIPFLTLPIPEYIQNWFQVVPATFNTLTVTDGLTCSSGVRNGLLANVTDSTTSTVGATITGGGTNHVTAVCNFAGSWVVLGPG